MEIVLDQEIRPLNNDQLVYKITSIQNAQQTFTFGDILNIHWQNLTTNDQAEDNYYLSEDATLCETPFVSLVQVLTKSVGCCCTLEIVCKGRFLSNFENQPDSDHSIVLEFKKVVFSKNNSNFLEQEKHAELRKTSGNKCYGEKQFDSAIKFYTIATKLVEKLPLRVEGVQFSCLNNMAACFMQMNEDKKALEVLQKVEQVDPNNVKMLWRSGRALLNLGEFKDSEKYLVKARELDEGSGVIKKDLAKVRMLLEQEEAKKRELYKKMMSTLTADGNEPKVQVKHNVPENKLLEAVEKATESENERIQATKEVHEFLDKSAEVESKLVQDVNNFVEIKTGETEKSDGNSEYSEPENLDSSSESEPENIEYQKLESPVPSLQPGTPDDYVPFEQAENFTFETENIIKKSDVKETESIEEVLENTTFNFSEKKSQDSESEVDGDSVATEQLIGETIDDSNLVQESFEELKNDEEACGDAMLEVQKHEESVPKPEVSENPILEQPDHFTLNPIDCSEDLSQEKNVALKEVLCEDYDEEGENSCSLPPSLDRLNCPQAGLDVIEEVEKIEVEEEEEEKPLKKVVDIPIKNEDFFDDVPQDKVNLDVIDEPVTGHEKEPTTEPATESAKEPKKYEFTPIQARNQAMKKSEDQKPQQSKHQKQNQEQKQDFMPALMIGAVVILLAAVGLRFLS